MTRSTEVSTTGSVVFYSDLLNKMESFIANGPVERLIQACRYIQRYVYYVLKTKNRKADDSGEGGKSGSILQWVKKS